MHGTLLLINAPSLAWIPALPLAAFALLILFGRRLGRFSGWLAVAALLGALAKTLSIAGDVWGGQQLIARWAWLWPGDAAWRLGLSVDGLTLVMLLVVTGIAPMIALYSIGYMHDDPRFSRYFAYFSLFCASMLTLVMADHFLLLYAGWELVGLCSYLLISFWFEKPAAAAAGRKAFITTRIGDTGLFLGILLLWMQGGTLHFRGLEIAAHQLSTGWLTLISALIFFGAVGKSAQIPLHVWLPDAMEGPTPVSALIHAATMVAAGVYLVARTAALFTPQSLALVLGIGLATHLFASTVALTQTDIKRILAYSTLSHLGLMMTALGLGAVTAAMFHLMTHAFFKALLFLGAGSVIHATHQQELGQLGGLRREMPWTATLCFIGALSMSGGVFFSGFWSKDAILLAAREARPWLFWTLLASAVMTAGYAFRLYLRCFHGGAPVASHAPGPPPHAPHESPLVMTLPMTVLAVGAVAAGLLGSPWSGQPFFRLFGEHHLHEGLDVPILVWSTLVLVVGIALAWVVGAKRRNLLPEGLRPLGARLYRLAFNKYYVDEFYEAAIVRPCLALARGLQRFDQAVIDGAVNAIGLAGETVSRAKAWVDRTIVDGAVNGIAFLTRWLGAQLRQVQTGIIQHYLLVVIVAVVALSFVVLR
ncbi:MAG: NADH-quinone oxidoreductase subunit L [Candidatus Omnitrophica bacterium]|nr:NADH-quinone oxidoreductase subunit L [Candidatus Omnitrophota bacterium]